MKRRSLLFFLTAFIFGFTIAVALIKTGLIFKDKNFLSIVRSQNKKLTNPLLDCELYQDSKQNQIYTSLIKKKVNEIINNYQDYLIEYSVYYRDLNNGPWIGINEKALFSPVSLLKVPVMIAYLKKAETEQQLLEKKIIYTGQHILVENIQQTDRLKVGQNYSIDELLRRMISLSDNIAFEILNNNVDRKYLKSVHQELDIVYPDSSTPENFVNIKSYAGLFRVLYNATYLNREMSERALNYLTQSSFNLGIKAGLPKTMKTALKYGVRDIDQEGISQIHDCGIVYSEKWPYLICIMTKGKDKNKLVDFIREVSKTIYNNI